MAVGFAELICLGVFFTLCLIVAALFLVWQIKRLSSSTAAPEPAATGKPPPLTPTNTQPAYSSLVGDASVAVVARLAEQFCPACRAPLDRDAPEGLCPACLLAGGFASEQVDPDRLLVATTPPGENAPSLDHDVASLQTLFPQLEILELLGRGGMGSVYKVRQRNLDRIVALKVIPPASARDPEFAERFAREARALARLNHPNIVTVYDFGQSGDVYYLLMEYVDGVNLRHTLRAGRLQPEEALAVVPQICDALQYAHDQGVVHRDIKPENVLLDRSGRIKIADFGLAKLLGIAAEELHLTRTQQVMGTPRYMAPEQIERPSSVDHRADIYSLGVVIYEMLTGELPVGRFPPPSQRAGVDARIDQVVLRSLEKEPELRYQRASEVKSELVTAAGTLSEQHVSAPRFPTPALVYHYPKPPYVAGDHAAVPSQAIHLVLLLAAGMLAGCFLLTAGLVLLVVALLSLDPGSQAFGGWLGSAFGLVCGGAGSLVGSYNSYRQLAGAEDLLRTPRTTWFDWTMRGYLVLGGLLVAAAFLVMPQNSSTAIAYPTLLVIGSVMLFQGSLFALIRSLLPTRSADSQFGPDNGEPAKPSLWRAAGVTTTVLTLLWFAVILDVFYATPAVAADHRTAEWMTYLFYQRWQVLNWAIGIALIPVCFAILASCWSLGLRARTGIARTVSYPFEHPGWLLAVAILGLSSLIFPWVKIQHVADHTITIQMTERRIERDVASIDMPKLAGLAGRYRFASREVVAVRIAIAATLCLVLAGLALLSGSVSQKIRSLVSLVAGLVLLACAIQTLHDMADQPARFFLDARTLQGINEFHRSMQAGAPDLAEWSKPLAEVITVRPSLGFFALLATSLGAIFLGLSGLSWESQTAPHPFDSAGPVPYEADPVPAKPAAFAAPGGRAREAALAQVRGPATGLLITGLLGLSLTGLALLLSMVLTPTATSTSYRPACHSRQLAWAAIACRDPAALGAASDVVRRLPLRHPFRLAQQFSRRHISPQEAHASWMKIAMPALLSGMMTIPISLLLVIGAVKMRKLESYGLAMSAAILACIPCSPMWLLGFPMGIWALSVLLRPEVKAAFDAPVESV